MFNQMRMYKAIGMNDEEAMRLLGVSEYAYKYHYLHRYNQMKEYESDEYNRED
ncbi:hypothetical protein [Weissella paramesenteroides]|uniref:hypothetical protein n=1 Tax=Weissella paramesenteroides TaxID=1249 RepID=UPI001A993375|nr:hypothetical protein [Weissella paramesenteroides]